MAGVRPSDHTPLLGSTLERQAQCPHLSDHTDEFTYSTASPTLYQQIGDLMGSRLTIGTGKIGVENYTVQNTFRKCS